MAYVDIVTALALIQFLVFNFKVGHARSKFGVKAPAITGNDIFERHFRVHQNTLESLIVFLPGLYLFSRYWNPLWAAGLGVVYPHRPGGLRRGLRQGSGKKERGLRPQFLTRDHPARRRPRRRGLDYPQVASPDAAGISSVFLPHLVTHRDAHLARVALLQERLVRVSSAE